MASYAPGAPRHVNEAGLQQWHAQNAAVAKEAQGQRGTQRAAANYQQPPAQGRPPHPTGPATDMSVYPPGRAKPTQQPSAGTPYGQWVPGTQQDHAQQPANPFANMAPGVYYGGQQIPGNQQQALQAAMAQRDAMAVLVNNNNMQYSLANAFGQDLGRPQFDYGSAMQQAQNMVANGFYNPFTQFFTQATDPVSQLGQYAPPTTYSPGPQPFPPIGGFGFNPPNPPQSAAPRPSPPAPESYYPGFDPRTQDQYGRPLPSGPARGYGPPPSVFRDGDRMTTPPGYSPGTAQPIQPPSQESPLGSIGTDLRSHGGDLVGRPVLSPPGYGVDPDGRRMILDYRDSDRDGVDDRDQPFPGAPPFRSGPARTVGQAPPRPATVSPALLSRPGAPSNPIWLTPRSRHDGPPPSYQPAPAVRQQGQARRRPF